MPSFRIANQKPQPVWEPSAEVYARYLAMTSSYALVNGGIYSFFWGWASIPDLDSQPNFSFFYSTNVSGIVSLIGAAVILMLEFNPLCRGWLVSSEGKILRYWSRIVLYLTLAVIVGFQFTLLPAASCLFITSGVIAFASFAKEPVKRLPR